MNTERFSIKNRHGLKLVLQVDTLDNPKNLVFMSPGQGGFIEQKHIETFAQVFLENNFRVVRFDPTHSIGESEGDMIDVTYDSYIEDLEDVINWARQQSWFQQPFTLCGHSMGAQSTCWYSEQHPDEVFCVAAMAPTINYDLYIKTINEEEKRGWQDKGYKEMYSRSKPGVIKRIGWSVNESLKKYDLLPLANKLTMPVLDVVGEFDHPCPVKHQQTFMDAVASKHKKLVVIPGADHNYRDNDSHEYDEKLTKAKEALSSWLHDINTEPLTYA